MKKTVTILLVLALVFALPAAALAYTGSTDPLNKTILNSVGDKDVPIKITTSAEPADEVIAVGISQTDLQFTYTGGKFTWNPETLTYSKAGSGWDQAKNIDVVNYSNIDLNVTATINNEVTTYGVTPTVDKMGAQKLNKADTQGLTTAGKGEAQVVTYTVNVQGDPTDTNLASPTVIANLHLAITK